MARRYLMNWRPDEKRWRVMHKGKRYVVSCRQLGTADTMEASWRAANEWWEGQLKILDAPAEDAGEAKIKGIDLMKRKLKAMSDADRREIVDSLLDAGAYDNLLSRRDEIDGAPKSAQVGQTVGDQAAAWRSVLLSKCRAGNLSAGRYEAYLADIAKFVRWIGSATDFRLIKKSTLEEFFGYLSAKVEANEYASPTAHGIYSTAKRFISWLAENEDFAAPKNLDSPWLRFNAKGEGPIEIFTVEEIRTILAACDQFSEKLKLYILFSLNAGLYQMDLAEMRQDEIDWENGLLRRARTKTRKRGGLIVTYKMWPEVFSLARKYRSAKGPLVFTSGDGNPLARRWLVGDKTKRYDLIGSSWSRLAKRMGVPKHRLGMKHLRKTSASILGTHPQYKYYSSYFLAHAPKGMAQESYVIPSEPEFFEALGWLRMRILGAESS